MRRVIGSYWRTLVREGRVRASSRGEYVEGSQRRDHHNSGNIAFATISLTSIALLPSASAGIPVEPCSLPADGPRLEWYGSWEFASRARAVSTLTQPELGQDL